MQFVVFVASLLFIGMPQGQPTQTASVEGVVVKLGTSDAVIRAQVVLSRTEGGATGSLKTATDGNGKFVVRNIPPGRYRVFATRDGYMRAEYGQRTPGGTGKPITLVAGQELKDVGLSLTPTGTISGRVYDRDGDPVVNANVQLLASRYANGQRVLGGIQSARTNDLGEYRLYWLNPGKYIVSAAPPEAPRIDGNSVALESGAGGTVISTGGVTGGVVRLNANFAASVGIVPSDEIGLPVYFPGTTDSSGAAPIDLRPGATYSGVDLIIVYVKALHVRGRLTSSVTGQPPRGGQVMLVSRSIGAGTLQRNARISSAGEFDFEGVTPGSYDLVSVANEPSLPGVAGRLTGRVPLEVGNVDVNNVSLVLQQGFSLSGRLLIDGQPPTESPGAPNVVVSLRFDPPVTGPGFPPSNGIVASSDGTFTLMGVSRGNYQIIVNNLPRNSYIKSALMAGTDALNSGLRIEGESRGTLEIQIGRQAGTFDATVLDETQEPAFNVMVVLVPDPARRQRSEAYRSGFTDNSGHIHFDGVAPGDYKAFAWDGVIIGAWQDPDFMRMYEDRGKPLRILESGTASGELRLIKVSQ